MSFDAIIGALGVVLGLDKAEFDTGLTAAQKQLQKSGKDFEKLGGQLEGIGARLSIGLTAPIAAIGITSVKAAVESRQAFAQVQAALSSMAGASGKTAEQLKASAGALQDLSLFDDDDILVKVTANLLTFGNVSGEAFDRAQLAAVNLSARLGQDLQSSAIQVGKALNDPIKGVTALQRVGVSFTEAQREQIKAMTEAGNVAGAQSMILAELEKQFGGAAAAQRAATPDAALQQSWRDFTEVVGEIAVKVLPPLTDLLAKVLSAFNGLPEPVQSGIVVMAGLAAAIGPVVTVVGGMVSAFGMALPVLASVGPAVIGVATAISGGLVAAFTASMPVIASWAVALNAAIWPVTAIAAAVAAAVVVWKNWDTIEPILRRLYTGVKTWLLDKLGAVLKFVEGKVKAVGDAFYKLWDRVVGHSYVPDLVDGIAHHFDRLDQVMVDPALAANDNVAEAFLDSAEQIGRSIDGLFRSLKSKDWGGAIAGLGSALQGIAGAFQTGGLGGGLGAAGGALAQVMGGKTGRAIGGGLSIAGSAAGLGALLSGGGLAAGVANGIMGLGGSAALAGGIGSGLMGLGAVLGPIGLAAGALYAAAKLFNVGGKPSNKGAGYDLVSGQLSGNKRSAETEEAVRAAGDAIRQGQAALEAAGLKLGSTVNGLVLGTRDLTQIYLSNGRTLTAAVGDSGAAVDVALRAVLDGAEYASEAQATFVRSLLAAGKGFEDVLAGLQRWEVAQSLPQQLADEILRLTDEQAYDTEQLKRTQADRRKAIEAQLKEGLLTADQMADINDKLAKLDKLEMEALAKRFTDTTTDIVAENDDYADALGKARDDEVKALQRQAQEAARAADRFRGLADGLAEFSRGLAGEMAGAGDPRRATAFAKGEFDKISARAAAGDADAMAALPDAFRAWFDAASATATDARQLQAIRAAGYAAAQKAEVQARAQVDRAEAQLARLNDQVQLLQQLDLSVGAVGVQIEALTAATDAHAEAQLQVSNQLAGLVAQQRADLDAVAERQDALLAEAMARQEAMLAGIVINTAQTARYLDDVTQGGDSLRTVAA